MSKDQQPRTNPGAAGHPMCYQPPGWPSTSNLEQELFLAVVGDSNCPQAEDRFRRLDDYFATDPEENERQYRRSRLSLLADFRLQLAVLLGGPREP